MIIGKRNRVRVKVLASDATHPVFVCSMHLGGNAFLKNIADNFCALERSPATVRRKNIIKTMLRWFLEFLALSVLCHLHLSIFGNPIDLIDAPGICISLNFPPSLYMAGRTRSHLGKRCITESIDVEAKESALI